MEVSDLVLHDPTLMLTQMSVHTSSNELVKEIYSLIESRYGVLKSSKMTNYLRSAVNLKKPLTHEQVLSVLEFLEEIFSDYSPDDNDSGKRTANTIIPEILL